jgi:hypothetical protein
MAGSRQDRVKVNVKVKRGSNAQETIKDLLRDAGVLGATQVFPDETDPDLASLYMLDISPTAARKTIGALRKNERLQYVEGAAPRRLIR